MMSMKSTSTNVPEFFFSKGVGKTLKERRIHLDFSIHYISSQTKIRSDYLEAIENGNFNYLPHDTHTLGFVRQYAKFLGLDSDTAATKYLLERGPISSTYSFRMKSKKRRKALVGTKMLGILFVALAVVGIGYYVIAQVLILFRPPNIELISHRDNEIVYSRQVELIGSTTPGSQIEIDGIRASMEEDGNFSATLQLREGINEIEVVSKNRRGKESIVNLTLLSKE
jgi:cytoskeletal protein RodZ